MARQGLIAALVLSFAAPGFAEDSEPGEWIAPEVTEFGDWSAACDNARECTAVSVSRDYVKRIESTDPGDYASPKLWVKRSPSPGAQPRVFVDTATWGEAGDPGELTLHVYYDCDGDCTGRAYRLKRIGKGRFGLAPDQVAAFFAESSKTSRAATRRSGGAMHGIISTSGMTAAMRLIDEVQERRGSVTAIYGKGKRAASTMPPAPVRETVRAVRGIAVPPTEMPGLAGIEPIRREHCSDPQEPNPAKFQRFRLRNGQALWSMMCGGTPHNPAHLWLVETGADRYELFKLPRPEQGRDAELPILPNSRFDPVSGQLTAHYKGGDTRSCGWTRSWAWTGTGFAMIAASEMPACFDVLPHQWLQTYQAISR